MNNGQNRGTTEGQSNTEVLSLMVRELIAEKKSKRFGRYIITLILLGYLSILVYGFATASNKMNNIFGPDNSAFTVPHMASVNIYGLISNNTSANADDLIQQLHKAFSNPSSTHVLLNINSPGGRPVQAAYIYDEIIKLKNKYNKKVYAVIEDMGTSAAYLIAASADEIIANKTSVVGSIGVRMDGFNFTKLMKAVGIRSNTMTAGENKDILSPFTESSEAQISHIQGVLDNSHSHFINYIKESRGEKLSKDKNIFSGLFWSGEQALKLGLIDKIGSKYQLRRDLDVDLVLSYSPSPSYFSKFFKNISSSVSSSIQSNSLLSVGF